MTEVTSRPRCFMRHVRQTKQCSSGARRFWQDRGWDWSDFLANGIDAETLLETGDPRALRVVEAAEREHG